ncbi:MAG: DUF3108 domain-containing protein [Prevotella sp.]|jgi:hypothetical protein
MKKNLKIALVLLPLLLGSICASAQCSYKNTAFKPGEHLSYNLYFNWKFVWVKVGTASFSTVKSIREGVPAYRGSLITRANNKLERIFVLRDTLLCYNSLKLEPLYYRKGAREGKRYTVDEVFYSYPNGKCSIRQHRQHHDGTHTWNKATYDDCVYDMMSIFMRARSFDPSGWKKGHDVNFPMADGKKRYPAKLRYEGKQNVKTDNGHTYRCLKLAYMENDKGEGFEKIVDFYVTDDNNHVPVRLDMHLRFGSAKAFLVNMRGVRSQAGALVK